jgi:hypothetical protein
MALLTVVSVAQDPAKPAVQQEQTPEALLADLYKQHNAKKGPFFQTEDRALVDKYFVKSTADLIWKLNNTKSTDMFHGLGGDPMYGVPPDTVTGLNIEKHYDAPRDEMPEIPVRFIYRRRELVTYFHFKKDNGVWKIDDIQWPDAVSLLETLNRTNEIDYIPPPTTPNSGFSGIYKVGEDICNALPIAKRNASRVRCSNTHADETFRSLYYKEGVERTYAGEAENPRNKFVFDPGFNTGKYYPGDGTVLRVKRIK